MSNRSKWAHWRRPKHDKLWRLKQWPLGIAVTGLGSLLVLSGLQGLHDGALWYQRFSFIFGRLGIAPTVSLRLIGGVFIVAGVALLVLPEYP